MEKQWERQALAISCAGGKPDKKPDFLQVEDGWQFAGGWDFESAKAQWDKIDAALAAEGGGQWQTQRL